jgi:hypothetical protein
MALVRRGPGAIVYSTADSAAQAFDRELMPQLPSADRVAYEPDYEVVAFEEELARGKGR